MIDTDSMKSGGASFLLPRKPYTQDFSVADRHTRRVRLLKWTLPLVILSGILMFGGMTWLNLAWTDAPDIKIATTDVASNQLTMLLPHLSGFNGQNQPYNVTAKSATQRVNALGLVELTDLEAVIGMGDQSKATLKALSGQLDSKSKRLTLRHRVTVTSTKDYSVDLSSAEVDFESHIVTSKEPVTVRTTSGVIRGGEMSIVNEGETITFSSGVRATFQKPSESEVIRPVVPQAPLAQDATGATP